MSENVGEAERVVGDDIDDVADIARDLEQVSLRWAVSVDDALWHLRHLYAYHWGEHLRSLQLLLHRLRVGG